MVQKCTGNLSGNFDSYEVQHLFACYLYSLKYYELLEAMRGRSSSEDIPAKLGIAALLV